ncbi:hypothetical protein MTQ12_01765 [Brevibacterium sp. R8603A2]|uniref:hypothetical protein n=1 Tax=Brevibacterium sp. R8603A2 TaxID=2929779 RepID=UPI001FF73E73|nr:hypothetical protein [Brevibacterium sp. R8603A2]MCK1801787.1 hypothetical protein [Brevibacterium sp. R8603A2]
MSKPPIVPDPLPAEVVDGIIDAETGAELEAPTPQNGEDEQASRSVAAKLVALSEELVDVIAGPDGEPHAVRKAGPRIALRLRGRDGLRQTLAREHYARTGAVASSNALSDALAVLEGQAQLSERVELPLRITEQNGVTYIDMGTPTGEVIAVSAAGWKVTTEAPVLFRRTELTGEMCTPTPGGDLNALRSLLNVDEKNFRLLVGWLIHALMPDMPHAVLALTGQQGTGKTVSAQTIIRLIDPSPALTRSAPRDIGQWSTTASACWISGIDNVSTIQQWFSDAMCRAVTGEGFVNRALYTDSDLSVTEFRRCVVLTSIDAGAMQGDLAERLLPIELQPIAKRDRKTDMQITEALSAVMPDVLGGLLDLLVQVLEALPSVHPDELPRMADFARVLAAVDKVAGWTTFDDYAGTATEVAESVIESDPFASAVRELVRSDDWEGSATDLLEQVTPDRAPKGWPKSPRGAAGALKRVIPALGLLGIRVQERARTGVRGRGYYIENINRPGGINRAAEPSQPSPPSLWAPDQQKRSDGCGDGSHAGDGSTVTTAEPGDGSTVTKSPTVTTTVTTPRTSHQQKHHSGDGSDGSDGSVDSETYVTGTAHCLDCGNPLHNGTCIRCQVESRRSA